MAPSGGSQRHLPGLTPRQCDDVSSDAKRTMGDVTTMSILPLSSRRAWIWVVAAVCPAVHLAFVPLAGRLRR